MSEPIEEEVAPATETPTPDAPEVETPETVPTEPEATPAAQFSFELSEKHLRVLFYIFTSTKCHIDQQEPDVVETQLHLILCKQHDLALEKIILFPQAH